MSICTVRGFGGASRWVNRQARAYGKERVGVGEHGVGRADHGVVGSDEEGTALIYDALGVLGAHDGGLKEVRQLKYLVARAGYARSAADHDGWPLG